MVLLRRLLFVVPTLSDGRWRPTQEAGRGVAMGLITSKDKSITLTDISGFEDHLVI